MISRGRYTPVTVYIDEDSAYGGLAQLNAYLPAELHAVGMWDRGTVVRIYTRSLAGRLAQGRGRLRQASLPVSGLPL